MSRTADLSISGAVLVVMRSKCLPATCRTTSLTIHVSLTFDTCCVAVAAAPQDRISLLVLTRSIEWARCRRLPACHPHQNQSYADEHRQGCEYNHAGRDFICSLAFRIHCGLSTFVFAETHTWAYNRTRFESVLGAVWEQYTLCSGCVPPPFSAVGAMKPAEIRQKCA